MENKKTYGDVKEYQRVISSKGDAVDVLVEVMDNAELSGEHVAASILLYVNKTIRDEKKVYAIMSIIKDLIEPFPDEVKLRLFVNEKETTITEFLEE